MNTNHLDARAITQPGGIYASANDGILKALQAYFEFKDRQRQGEREMKRDERQSNRQQRLDGVGIAQTLGVRPSPADSGWLQPSDEAAIDAALTDRAKRVAAADASRAHTSAMDELTLRARRLELARAGGLLPDEGDLLADETAESTAAAQGAEQRQLQIEALRRSLLPKPTPQMPERSGWQAIKGRDGQAWLLNRATGEMRPAIPGPDQMTPAPYRAANQPADPSMPAGARPPVGIGGVGPAINHDQQRIARALFDHAGIDASGSFAGLLPDLTGADADRRAVALRSMPAAWRLRAIDALRRSGVGD